MAVLLCILRISFCQLSCKFGQPNFSFWFLLLLWLCFIVLQTAWKVGRDGIEAGTNLVPVSLSKWQSLDQVFYWILCSVLLLIFFVFSWYQDSIPRPVARISVTFVALSVALFVLKSFLSTAFFVLVSHPFSLYLLINCHILCWR